MRELFRESIEIRRPPQEVFQYLRLIEPRLRLNPSYKLLEFKKLTEGPIEKGSRYRVKAVAGARIIEYEGEVVEFIENERLTTADTEGRLRVTLTLKPTDNGTLLSHEEEFNLPDEILYHTEEEPEIPFWQRIIKLIITVESTRIDERQRRREELLLGLRQNLRLWLRRLKEDLEASV